LVINGRKSWFTRLINCIRIYNIPLINFIIIGILGFFLIKLTTKYTGLYMKSSLITLIVTNLVLYGISETLAQSILSYKPNQPGLSFRINELSQAFSFNPQDLLRRRLRLPHADETPVPEPTDGDIHDTNNHTDDEDIERFLDYLQENSSDNEDFENFGELPPPIIDLTYFQFNRLAGFMCWGCILAFFQCWWYKFLQIYSKDPKFIEVLRKVLTDQLCYSPISLFCFFTYGTIILENGTWELAKKKLRKVYLKTLVINYCVWFPVQFFNFLLVSRNFQVPFSSSVSVLWNCFLSMRNSRN
jgi:hypothetical protein